MSQTRAQLLKGFTNTSAPDDTITVDSSGRLLVGTTSGTAKVEAVDSSFHQFYARGSGNVGGVRFGNTTKTNGYIYYDNGGNMNFHANGAERIRIQAAGGISFNGDTAAANALDDYEEGTWTPRLGGSTTDPSVTYSSQSGAYEKIGSLVHASFFLNVSAVSSQGSGHFYIRGLPFNSVSSPVGASEIPAVCLQTEPFQDGDGDHRIQSFRTTGSNSFLLGTYKDQSTGGAAVPPNAAANVGTGYLIGHITYRTGS